MYGEFIVVTLLHDIIEIWEFFICEINCSIVWDVVSIGIKSMLVTFVI